MQSVAASEFVQFVGEAPVIQISGGVAFIRYRGAPERAMSVRALTKGVERAQRALRMHAAGDDHIVVDD